MGHHGVTPYGVLCYILSAVNTSSAIPHPPYVRGQRRHLLRERSKSNWEPRMLRIRSKRNAIPFLLGIPAVGHDDAIGSVGRP
jgi:hypothetical protein